MRQDSFVDLNFHRATVVHSNLGGLGGQCGVKVFDCDENEVTDYTPHEILIRGLGINNVGPDANGEVIDLRMTNTSEYKQWVRFWNGIKRGDDDTSNTDAFAVINLLQPRSVAQVSSQWSSVLTFTQFKFDFISGASQTPITLERTYLSFWDYDESLSEDDPDGTKGDNIMEAIQPDPQKVTAYWLADGSELEVYPTWAADRGGFVNATALVQSHLEQGTSGASNVQLAQTAVDGLFNSWSSPVLTSGTFGLGGDNPTDPLAPTMLQKQRAVLFQIDNVSTFELRLAIYRCCGNGRNFLIGGFTQLQFDICDEPPSEPPSPSLPPSPPEEESEEEAAFCPPGALQPYQMDAGSTNVSGPTWNGMLHPLLPMRLSGVIWYQGEGARS